MGINLSFFFTKVMESAKLLMMIGFFNDRLEHSLYALIIMIGVQAVLMALSIMMKKTSVSLPVWEWMIRPLIVMMCDRLNRSERSGLALVIRGMLVVCVMVALTILGVYCAKTLMAMAGIDEAWSAIILLCFLLSPIAVVSVVYNVFVEKPNKGAYLALSRGLNHNLVMSDTHGLRRAACKNIAVALVEWVLSPLILYSVGGVMVAFLYATLSLFIRVVGRHDLAFTSVFGYVYKGIHIMIQCGGAGLIWIASFFSAGGQPVKAFKGVVFPLTMVEATLAYAQNITLGGVYQTRHGETIKAKWIGAEGATAKLAHQDVLRVIIHYGITILITVAILMAIHIYS